MTPNNLVSLLERTFSFAIFANLLLVVDLLHRVLLAQRLRCVPQSGTNQSVDEALAVGFGSSKRKAPVMQEDYDRGKCAALLKEGREIAGQLKVETESIRRQMARVLKGGEDEPLDVGGTHGDNISTGGAAGKSSWQFWR